jgi:predicted alpha/beta hydrolase
VLIHEAFGNRSHFAAQLDHLSERNRVLVLDLRGHGEGDIPGSSVALRDFAADVIGVCEAAGVDRAVCGHSMGGIVALEVATGRQISWPESCFWMLQSSFQRRSVRRLSPVWFRLWRTPRGWTLCAATSAASSVRTTRRH